MKCMISNLSETSWSSYCFSSKRGFDFYKGYLVIRHTDN